MEFILNIMAFFNTQYWRVLQSKYLYGFCKEKNSAIDASVQFKVNCDEEGSFDWFVLFCVDFFGAIANIDILIYLEYLYINFPNKSPGCQTNFFLFNFFSTFNDVLQQYHRVTPPSLSPAPIPPSCLCEISLPLFLLFIFCIFFLASLKFYVLPGTTECKD